MKSNKLRDELKTQTNDQVALDALQGIADKLAQEPRTLSKADKKHMLRAAYGSSRRFFGVPLQALRIGFSGLVIAVLVPLVAYSQPGDGVLYVVKQRVEDVRSIVQPSFTPSSERSTDQIRRDDSGGGSNSGKGSSEDDNSGKGSSNSGGDDDSKTEDDNHDDSSSGSGGRGSDDTDQAEDAQDDSDHNAARDQCRAALDLRKDAGEDISSDQYKACDS